ncbi:MAG: hypothetical protein LQ340_001944 [Diploschistes diacapsis]|nr:MAG: hypothetical protein LQ340_001944 [Diploschistes diacapsis]
MHLLLDPLFTNHLSSASPKSNTLGSPPSNDVFRRSSGTKRDTHTSQELLGGKRKKKRTDDQTASRAALREGRQEQRNKLVSESISRAQRARLHTVRSSTDDGLERKPPVVATAEGTTSASELILSKSCHATILESARESGNSCLDPAGESLSQHEDRKHADSGFSAETERNADISGSCVRPLTHYLTPSPSRRSSHAGNQSPSPSGLQLPELQFSSVRGQRSYKSPTRSNAAAGSSRPSAVLSPSRLKLKDKLRYHYDDRNGTPEKQSKEITPRRISPPLLDDSKVSASSVFSLDPNVSDKEDIGNSHTQLTDLAVRQAQGPRMTYAAGHRTVLQEPKDTYFEHSILAGQQSPPASKRIRELPPPESSLKVTTEDEEFQNSSQNGLRSIYELREAGSIQRITRQTEALMDDIEGSVSASQQRLALVELIRGLQSASFKQQFWDSGCEVRLLNILESGSDQIIRFLLSVAMLSNFDHSGSAVLLDHQSRDKAITFWAGCLDDAVDINALLVNRRFGLTRDLQREIRKVCDNIKALPLWGQSGPPQLSCQMLSLRCLEHVVRQSREAGSTQALLSRPTIERLLEIVSQTDFDSTNASELAMLISRLALSTLESSAIVYSVSDQACESLWSDGAIRKLGMLITRIPKKLEKNQQLLSLGLRLGLNLSNSSLAACTAFARPEVITTILHTIVEHFSLLSLEGTDDERNIILDNLVLSLGFLINVSEKNERTRELFLRHSDDASAPIETVIRLFVTKLEDASEVTSENEIKFNIPFGWLAVLLAYLSKNIAVRDCVKRHLAGGTLRRLLDAVAEFLTYHRRVAAELRHTDADVDIKTTFTDRLQNLVNTLKAEEGLP